MKNIYLDNAATTPMRAEVIEEITALMKSVYGNPSSTHTFGREAKALIELSRKKIAKILNVLPAEIIFTSGGTESNNLIIRSAVEYLNIEKIITSPLEHKCVLETVNELKKIKSIQVQYVKVDDDGNIDYDDLEELLNLPDKKTLVCLMHANNEIGNLTDIRRVQKLCELHNTYFHTDTIQSIGHYPLDFSDIKVDFASFSAHKLYGPKGVGFAYIKKSTYLKPVITGGGQERNMRSGTENLYGIVGMAKALEIAFENLEKEKSYIENLKKYAIEQIKLKIPEIEFNGLSANFDESLYTVLSLRLPFKDELIGLELELKGIAASQGSACSSGANKVSSVIEAILSDEIISKTTPLRVSFSIYNTKEEIDILAETLKLIYEKHIPISA